MVDSRFLVCLMDDRYVLWFYWWCSLLPIGTMLDPFVVCFLIIEWMILRPKYTIMCAYVQLRLDF